MQLTEANINGLCFWFYQSRDPADDIYRGKVRKLVRRIVGKLSRRPASKFSRPSAGNLCSRQQRKHLVVWGVPGGFIGLAARQTLWCNLFVTVLPFCSPHAVLFHLPPLLHSDCQPHPSHQGHSTHLLSMSLAQHKDSCSPHAHCQIVLCFFACETQRCLCKPYLCSTSEPCLNPEDFLSLLSLITGFGFGLPDPVGDDFLPCPNSVSLDSTYWTETMLFCNTGFSMCGVDFQMLYNTSAFPCFCCKLH